MRTSSDYFEVISTGDVEGIRKTLKAAVARPAGKPCSLVMITALEPGINP